MLTPEVYRDSRSEFCETFNQQRMMEAGLPSSWPQDNFSLSRKHVLRGIHYQAIQPQAKLVRVICGAVLNVAVDLRRSSPTFARHVAIVLSGQNSDMLWIPKGFGHAFLALTDVVGFAHKVTDYYSPVSQRTIVWNDPDLAIPWPATAEKVIVSGKDRSGASLRGAEVFPWGPSHVF